MDLVSFDVAKQHMTLVSALVSSYNGLVAGQIGNSNLTNEDYAQLDKDENRWAGWLGGEVTGMA